MCPAPGQIAIIICVRRAATSLRARKNCCTDCALYIICPASVDVTGITANLFVRRAAKYVAVSVCCVRRTENKLKYAYLFAQILYWFHANVQTRNA